jgi:hypothetical protein
MWRTPASHHVNETSVRAVQALTVLAPTPAGLPGGTAPALAMAVAQHTANSGSGEGTEPVGRVQT